MGLSFAPRMDTITLTAGAGMLIPAWKLRGPFAPGSGECGCGGTATLTITDSTGAVLAEFYGEVSSVGISFSEEAETVADIPHDANFVIYLTLDGGSVVAVSYGTVIRQEPRYSSG